ncbi:hypothetical protein CDEST_12617 [Colletotrichum destructivum]|uniref:BTB domain-containing protein n=1 Tax=Colletotrichum destructivum TaxID=34406 RepID=A0AAX4IWX8_9PEZI|nr:hypothetical protein CDEST_12617 [Colletotrichum destructivum]
MADEFFHKIDPDGDVLLILRNPNTPFAVWDEEEEIECLSPKRIDGKHAVPDYHNYPPPADDIWDSLTSEDETPVPAPLDPPSEPKEEPEIKYLVSSRHLTLASNTFEAELRGPWKEGAMKHTDGYHHIDASEWNSEALLILMRVIHGQSRSIPRQISLEMLAKIAVLVDYYDSLEVTEVYASIWIDGLNEKLPTDYSRDMVLWLLVSYVFQQDDIFSQMTKIAVTQSTEPVMTLELPIPSIVTDLIDRQRQEAVEFILNTLQTLLDVFRKESSVSYCSFECSSMLLGALTKEMDRHKLLDPAPKEPYTGYSIVGVEKMVKEFRSPYWNHRRESCVSNHSNHLSCNLKTNISTRLNTRPNATKEGFKLSEIQTLTKKQSLKTEITED